MKYDNYRVLEIDMTAKEYKAVKEFCQVLDNYNDYVDDDSAIFEFIEAIARNKDLGYDKKINIVEEN